LGRVDLSIIRDPATQIPKLPGTSLSGVARSYTAMQSPGKFSCAGKGRERGEDHCGSYDPACPVCIPYGFSKGLGKSLQGMAQFFDAQILFFPIATMLGTVWVTSPQSLEEIGSFKVAEDKFHPLGEGIAVNPLNFGWLMLERDEKATGCLSDLLPEIPDIIKNTAVLLHDGIFSKVINSNLEVRTSVSIDPSTGAAEEGALFTYEAIPRGTVFYFEVVYNHPKFFKVEGNIIKGEGNTEIGIEWVKVQVEKGLKLLEYLGIGGMNTRGMGRLRVLNL